MGSEATVSIFEVVLIHEESNLDAIPLPAS